MVVSALQKIKDRAQQGQCRELCARSLLTLVKWLQLDHKTLASISSQLKSPPAIGETTTLGTCVRNIRLLLEMEDMKETIDFATSNIEPPDKKGKP